MNVLFVCTGNTCRSPMAEHLLRRMLKEKGRADVEILSAGIAASGWLEFPVEARGALEKEGVVDVQHKAQDLSAELVKWADLILTMEEHHKHIVMARFPDAARKTHVLNAFAKLGDDSAGIHDPFGGPALVYEATLAQIKAALAKILSKI
jgi:protein-tyrosine-phosphatase